jgi:hypothetical protein
MTPPFGGKFLDEPVGSCAETYPMEASVLTKAEWIARNADPGTPGYSERSAFAISARPTAR